MRILDASQKKLLKTPEWYLETGKHLLNREWGEAVVDLSKLVGVDEPTLYRRIRDLYISAFENSLHQMEIPVDFHVAKKQLSKHTFSPKEFDPQFTMCHPVYSELEKQFKESQSGAGVDLFTISEYIKKLRLTFSAHFNELRVHDHEKYKGLSPYFGELEKGVNTTEGLVYQHMNRIVSRIFEEPLQIDPSLILYDIYIPPSAGYRYVKSKELKETPTTGDEKGVLLLEYVLAQIISAKKAEPIIIHGQPGHGKSSAARMLVHALTQLDSMSPPSERFTILFYEFSRLTSLGDDEYKVLSSRLPFSVNETFFTGKKTVLILDAMDERQIVAGSDEAFCGFVRRMFQLASDLNQKENTEFHLVLTGRSLFLPSVQGYFVGNYHVYEICDFNDSQISAWLKKFSRSKALCSEILLSDLKKYNLDELIVQPILLTMCALLFSDPQKEELLKVPAGRAVTKAHIYKQLIRWTFIRKWDKTTSHPMIGNFDDYFHFLQMIAFIMFKNDRLHISVSDLRDEIKKENYQAYDLVFLKEYENELDKIIRDLTLSFYFEMDDKRAFAFIHKSFSDYLAVNAVLVLLKASFSRYDDKSPDMCCNEISGRVYNVLKWFCLSPDGHIPFLIEVLSSESFIDPPLLKRYVYFFKKVSSHMYLDKTTSNPIPEEANVMSNLLYIISTAFSMFDDSARVAHFQNIHLKLLSREDWGRFIHFIHSVSAQLIILSGIDLDGARLSGASLFGAVLDRANLTNVILSGADLDRANLTDAILSGADLDRANLTDAILSGADLGRANLTLSHLDRAFLVGARLSGAFLYGARLSGAHLDRAFLVRARLDRAHLDGTDLSGADLSGARLDRAHLDRACLDGTCLDGAFLNRAFLFGASLVGASLSNISGWGKISSLENTNIFGIKNAPERFREFALKKGAVEIDPEKK